MFCPSSLFFLAREKHGTFFLCKRGFLHFNNYFLILRMVNEARYKKFHKSFTRKKFPILTNREKQREYLKKFHYGMTQEEYQKVMFEINAWVQAEYSGEISYEVQTRKVSDLWRHRFLTAQQVADQVGPRAADVQVRAHERVIEEAHKIYQRKRDTYLENVKKFIGNLLKEFITDDLLGSLKSRPEFLPKVNMITNAADFMDWLEKMLFIVFHWDTQKLVTELSSSILNKVSIQGNGNSGMKYLASMDLLIERLKRLKISILVEKFGTHNNNVLPDAIMRANFETAVNNEIDLDGLIISRIYNECKENGISSEIKSAWIQREVASHLKDQETPFVSLAVAIAEIRKDFDYMLSKGQTHNRSRFSISVNATEFERPDKCRKCVEEKGADRVFHRWYDCFDNPKSKNYRGEKKKVESSVQKESKEKTYKINATEYKEFLELKKLKGKTGKTTANKIKVNAIEMKECQSTSTSDDNTSGNSE